VGCGVDEVGHCDEGRGEANGGTIQGCDEDLAVVAECMCDVDVICNEVADEFAADVGAEAGPRTGGGYVCSSMIIFLG
jgi:hypothetical protein